MNVNVCVAAPTPDEVPLCDLQRTAKQGEQRSVQVGGIYITGYEGSVLTDATCPSQGTWVELDLKSTANREQLRSMLKKAGKAYVVFEGDFYGPEVPDPKLPEAIRKSYQPGWGHLGAFRTKLVVHAIKSVKPVPVDQQRDSSPCMTEYENNNQADYGPLVIQKVKGAIKDVGQVAVPKACVAVFTEKEHKLLATTESDANGKFSLDGLPPGRYRLVVKSDPLCAANVPLRVVKRGKRNEILQVHMKPRGLDSCSYADLGMESANAKPKQ